METSNELVCVEKMEIEWFFGQMAGVKVKLEGNEGITAIPKRSNFFFKKYQKYFRESSRSYHLKDHDENNVLVTECDVLYRNC